MTPYRTWDEVPLTLRLSDLARVLQRSPRTIRQQLAMRPWLVPTPDARTGRTTPLTWDKARVQSFVARGVAMRIPRQKVS